MAKSPRSPAPTASFEVIHEGKAIRCYLCGATSWHPKDVSERYCGWCHTFHEQPKPEDPDAG